LILTTEIDKPPIITGETMKAAIKLVQDYFWPNARACLRQIGLTERHGSSRVVTGRHYDRAHRPHGGNRESERSHRQPIARRKENNFSIGSLTDRPK
jgi:hypothetical protein